MTGQSPWGTPSADSDSGVTWLAGIVTEVVRPCVTAKFDDAQTGALLVIVMLLAETPPLAIVIGEELGLVKVRFSGWLVPGYSGVVRPPPTVKFWVPLPIVQQNLVVGPTFPAPSVA